MTSVKSKNLVLDIVNTDKTFKPVEYKNMNFWQGKCLHCNTKLLICEDGTLWGNATVEHIVPRGKGGTDDLRNVALACNTCNFEKGVRHDRKRNKRSGEIINKLLHKRSKRWKDK